jgi:hypothetical protein
LALGYWGLAVTGAGGLVVKIVDIMKVVAYWGETCP